MLGTLALHHERARAVHEHLGANTPILGLTGVVRFALGDFVRLVFVWQVMTKIYEEVLLAFSWVVS